MATRMPPKTFLDPLSAGPDRVGALLGRLSPFLPRHRGGSRLAQPLAQWLAINYWTPAHFASLTTQCRDPLLVLSAREIEAITSGSKLELMPRHFCAFAAVDRLTRLERSSQPVSDQDLIACFATSICSDQSSLQPSWWFALYCGEPWASQVLRHDVPSPVHDMRYLRQLLPPMLRMAITSHGLDVISHLKTCAKRLPRTSALRPQRFVDWILEYGTLDDRELRLAMALTLLLLAELGQEFTSLLDLSATDERGLLIEASRTGPVLRGL